MKKLSVFQISLLAIFGAFALVGVLVFSVAVGGGTKAAVGPVTIWGTLDANAWNSVIRNAANTDTDLSQVTYVQQDPASYESDITQSLANGKGPDVFVMRQDYAYKDAGEVVMLPFSSLSRTQFQNAFIAAADPFIAKSGIVALPILADPLVLYWNKDLLASGGYAEPPQYWDQFYDIAQKLTLRSNTGDISRSGVALGTYSNIGDAKDILALLILQAGGTITTTDSSGDLISSLSPKGGSANSPAADALRFYTEFSNPSKVDYSWNGSLPDAETMFSNGDLALYVGYASEAQKIAAANPNLSFGIAPVPQVRTASYPIGYARVYGLAVSRTAKNPAGAFTVETHLDTATNANALSAALGMPPALRTALGTTTPGYAQLFDSQALIAHSWTDPDPAATARVFQTMIDNTTSGASLLPDAVQNADQQLSHILGL